MKKKTSCFLTNHYYTESHGFSKHIFTLLSSLSNGTGEEADSILLDFHHSQWHLRVVSPLLGISLSNNDTPDTLVI